MKEFIKIVVVAVVAGLLSGAVVALVGGKSQSVGQSGTRFPSGLSADTTSPVAGEVRGTTLTITGAATLSGATVVSTFTQGGGTTATSTDDASQPLPYSYFDTENWVSVTPNLQEGITYTLPSTAALTGLTTVGQCRTVKIFNATSTVTATLTIAKGDNMQLQVASTTASTYTSIPGLKSASLDICLATSTASSVVQMSTFK